MKYATRALVMVVLYVVTLFAFAGSSWISSIQAQTAQPLMAEDQPKPGGG